MRKERMVRMLNVRQWAVLIAITILLGSSAATSYPFSAKRWIIINAENNGDVAKEIVVQDGKEVLQLAKNHLALLDIKYTDFAIEFEVKGGEMPGIGFRSNDLLDFEYFYLRLANSGQKTALQYFPGYNGAEAWEIYNYPKYEAAADFPQGDWVHVKMEVYRDNMRVFVNKETSPNLQVKLQNTEQVDGKIFLKAAYKAAEFKNVKIRNVTERFEVEETPSIATFLSKWKLSKQFEVNFNNQEELYARYIEQKSNEAWREITADADGIVNLSKYYSHPKGVIIATSEVFSDKEQTVDLLFDYTFSMVVGFNREILFCGTELDTHNFMRVMDGEEKLSLQLKKGRNELIFIIQADDVWQKAVHNPPYLGRKQAANWGFIARLAHYDGIKL